MYLHAAPHHRLIQWLSLVLVRGSGTTIPVCATPLQASGPFGCIGMTTSLQSHEEESPRIRRMA